MWWEMEDTICLITGLASAIDNKIQSVTVDFQESKTGKVQLRTQI